jgi:hypothetical protein
MIGNTYIDSRYDEKKVNITILEIDSWWKMHNLEVSDLYTHTTVTLMLCSELRRSPDRLPISALMRIQCQGGTAIPS